MCEANDKCSEKPDEEGRAAYFFGVGALAGLHKRRPASGTPRNQIELTQRRFVKGGPHVLIS